MSGTLAGRRQPPAKVTRPNPLTPTVGDKRHRRIRALAIYFGLAVGYFGIGVWLAYGPVLVLGDALSRVVGARFVLFSRDPHLAAMGFVFTPLTTLVQLPLVTLLNPWPGLLAHAVPAIVVSSLGMAGAVMQLVGMMRDRRATRGWSYGVGAGFALHPFIIYYAANGMSEALFVLFSVICARFLLRWMISDDIHDLAAVGLGLAMAYLVRYDALASAAACAVLVAVTAWWRARGSRGDRRAAALMDVSIVLAPVVTTFLLWALVSWLITGELFAQFSSIYGNTEILRVSGGASRTPLIRVTFSITEWLLLEPFLLTLIASALVVTGIRREPDALPLIAVFGSVLVFQTLTYGLGGTFPFMRFAIVAIPLAASLAGIHRPREGSMSTRRAGPGARLLGYVGAPITIRSVSTRVGLVVALLPSFAVGWWGMSLPTYAPQEYPVPAYLTPWMSDSGTRLQAARQARSFSTERELAAYLDRLGLPDGVIVTDSVSSFAVVVASAHPRQFVVPSDEDFVSVLNDPAGNRVHYVLAVPNSGRGTTDALNRRYPTIYESGGGIASLVLEIPNSGLDQPDYRLYRVTR